jgi:hypothetical protein
MNIFECTNCQAGFYKDSGEVFTVQSRSCPATDGAFIVREKIDLDELNCTCASLVLIGPRLLSKSGTPAASFSAWRKWVAFPGFGDFQEDPKVPGKNYRTENLQAETRGFPDQNTSQPSGWT